MLTMKDIRDFELEVTDTAIKFIRGTITLDTLQEKISSLSKDCYSLKDALGTENDKDMIIRASRAIGMYDLVGIYLANREVDEEIILDDADKLLASAKPPKPTKLAVDPVYIKDSLETRQRLINEVANPHEYHIGDEVYCSRYEKPCRIVNIQYIRISPNYRCYYIQTPDGRIELLY